jgi:hypothetical protein
MAPDVVFHWVSRFIRAAERAERDNAAYSLKLSCCREARIIFISMIDHEVARLFKWLSLVGYTKRRGGRGGRR